MRKILGWVLLFLLSLAPIEQNLASGAKLYEQYCANCHGLSGEGGIGLPLKSRKLGRQLSDSYIISTIKHGRKGRLMPEFAKTLSSPEINQIVKHLRSWHIMQPPVYTKTIIQGDYNNGKKIYQAECAKCHGANLEGSAEGTGVTKSRPRKAVVAAPALSNPGFLRAAPDEMLKKIITEGREDLEMPAFGTKFANNEINDLVVYIRKRGTMLSAQWRSDPENKINPIFKFYESPYGMEETKNNLYDAIRGLNFRAYKPRHLEQDLIKKDEDYIINKTQTVFRFCNFKLLNDFLKIEPRLGVILPCNATVLKNAEGKILVVIPNLARIILMFNNRQLEEKTSEIIGILDEMVEEALL